MIFIGLGSNIGDGVLQLRKAIDILEKEGVHLIRKSSFYLSPAWGIEAQEPFINAVIEVDTACNPEQLLRICLETEDHMGRKRKIKWGPRCIDIDIIEYNRIQMDSEQLTLPHPWYTVRDFVLVPLAELEPGWIPTGESQTIEALIELLPDRKLVLIPDYHTE